MLQVHYANGSLKLSFADERPRSPSPNRRRSMAQYLSHQLDHTRIVCSL
jgi:hypothetical protein